MEPVTPYGLKVVPQALLSETPGSKWAYGTFERSSFDPRWIHGWKAETRPAGGKDPFEQTMRHLKQFQRLLEFEDGWNGPGTVRIKKETLQRATELSKRLTKAVHTTYGVIPRFPTLVPLGDGSIDIVWRTKTHELILNVPITSNSLPQFYGSDGRNAIEGIFSKPAQEKLLALWLSSLE